MNKSNNDKWGIVLGFFFYFLEYVSRLLIKFLFSEVDIVYDINLGDSQMTPT